MNTLHTFGDWLKQERTSRGYSQAGLAAVLGVHRTYITQLETGDSWPKPETRTRLHEVFGTTDDDLVVAGIAVRKEYPRAGGASRVIYEAASRQAEPDPHGVPAGTDRQIDTALTEIAKELRKVSHSRQMVDNVVNTVANTVKMLLALSPPPDAQPAPDRSPQESAPPQPTPPDR